MFSKHLCNSLSQQEKLVSIPQLSMQSAVPFALYLPVHWVRIKHTEILLSQLSCLCLVMGEVNAQLLVREILRSEFLSGHSPISLLHMTCFTETVKVMFSFGVNEKERKYEVWQYKTLPFC